MPESESGIDFFADARAVYESSIIPEEVLTVWEHLAYLLDQSEVDNEIIFDASDGFDWYKVMYGPAFTIQFQNERDGSLSIYSILRTPFLRFVG